MVTHEDSCFLQIFLWERFGSIAPKPMEFNRVTIINEVVDDKVKKKRVPLHA